MGRVVEKQSPPRTRQFLPFRARSSFVIRVVFVVVVLVFFQQQRLYWIYRDSLAAKYSPTLFKEDNNVTTRLILDDALRLQEGLLANRDKWEVLGEGYEGKTFKYNVFVIKTFTPGRSPFRNCAPGDANERWPTEIPASLTFGGRWEGENVSARYNDTASSFLSVQSYFMATSSYAPEWHLVTPLLPGGNILKLAKRLKQQHPYKHFREVDAAFRPTFNHLLRALETMHSAGYCHDDIKPANIFVNDDTHWVLGDLGNVRHISHPYHSSRLWVADNHQLPNCRANDVLRALKSYLQFLRAASHDINAFDAAFFDGCEPLSRLFWWTVADALTLTAADMRVRSEVENPEQPPFKYANVDVTPRAQPSLFVSLFFSKRRIVARAVELALETKFRERAARWAALTGMVGVPVQQC